MIEVAQILLVFYSLCEVPLWGKTVFSRRNILNRYMDQVSYSFEGIGQARDGCIMTAFGAWLELTFRRG